MLNRLCRKRFAVAVILCLTMVFSVQSGAVFADTAGDSAQNSAWNQFSKIENISDGTIRGVDFSMYQKNVEWKKEFKDYQQRPIENLMEFLKQQGVNTVTVKVAVNPSAGDLGQKNLCTLEDGIKTLKAAKAADLKTNMVLLFCDWMTDKNDQTPSKTWDGKDADAAAKAYTKDTVLAGFTKAGFTPDMITIGNNVNYNFLGYSGNDADKGWKAMGDISGIIKDSNKDIQVGIGIAAPGDAKDSSKAEDVKWVLQELNKERNGVQYDAVGVTLYGSYYSTEYIAALRDAFQKYEGEAKAAGKNLYVAGISFPTKDDKDTSATRDRQASQIYDVLKATVSGSNEGGLIYDNALLGWESSALVDNYGHLKKSIAAFAYGNGTKADVTEWYNPYEYGGEPGLKAQKVKIKKIDGMTKDMIRGVDVGSYKALQDAGVKFYNEEGKEEPLLKILSDHGVNSVRIRVWNDPWKHNTDGTKTTYGGGGMDPDRALELGKEAKKYGMSVTLDLFFSDFWADPTQQILPKAWKKDADDTEQLRRDYYDYTKEIFTKFKDANVPVTMVQLGNEITNGIPGAFDFDQSYTDAWGSKSKVKNRPRTACMFLNSAASAVRKVSPDTKIALQLETPNRNKYKTVMDAWEKYHVDYDVLGSSYYPFWAGRNGNKLSDLKDVQNLAKEYGKEFVVMETSWLSSSEDSDGTNNQVGKPSSYVNYKVGPQGQVDSLTDMYKVLGASYNGLGAYYWEPAWIPTVPGQHNWDKNKEISEKYGNGWAARAAEGYSPDFKMFYEEKPTAGASAWDNMGLFDFNGYMLQSLNFYKEAIGGTKAVMTVKKPTLTYNGKTQKPTVSVTIRGGKVPAKYYKLSGSTAKKNVGTYTVKATFKQEYKGVKGTVSVKYRIVPKKPAMKSLKKGRKSIKVYWKKQRAQVTGFQVQRSTSKTFKKSATKQYTVKSAKATTKKLTKLKAKKRYYVRVRTYKKIGKTTYYSAWSASKNTKTK